MVLRIKWEDSLSTVLIVFAFDVREAVRVAASKHTPCPGIKRYIVA